MRAIINRMIYDTDKAELIADDYPVGVSVGDFAYYHTVLYKTEKGNWFKTHLTRGGKVTIASLNELDAYDFLEATHHYDELEKHFGSELTEA